MVKATVCRTLEEFEAAGPGAVAFEFLLGKPNERGLMFKCPCCGEQAFLPTGPEDGPKRWNFDERTLTVTPSILWTAGCRWHGFLTNGEWRSC